MIKTAITAMIATAVISATMATVLKADTVEQRGNGTFVQEDFSCKVALADKVYLETAIPTETDVEMKEMMIKELVSTKKAINNNGGCK